MPTQGSLINQLLRRFSKASLSESVTIFTLPPELWVVILRHLDIKSFSQLLRTHPIFYFIFNEALPVTKLSPYRQWLFSQAMAKYATLFGIPQVHTPKAVIVQILLAQKYPSLVMDPTAFWPRLLQAPTNLAPVPESFINNPEQRLAQFRFAGSTAEIVEVLLGPALTENDETLLVERLALEPMLLRTALIFYGGLLEIVRAVKEDLLIQLRRFNIVEGQEELNITMRALLPDVLNRQLPHLLEQLPPDVQNQLPPNLQAIHLVEQLLPANAEDKRQQFYQILSQLMLSKRNSLDAHHYFAKLIPDFATLISTLEVIPQAGRFIFLLFLIKEYPESWRALVTSCIQLGEVIKTLPEQKKFLFLKFVHDENPSEWSRSFANFLSRVVIHRQLSEEQVVQTSDLYDTPESRDLVQGLVSLAAKSIDTSVELVNSAYMALYIETYILSLTARTFSRTMDQIFVRPVVNIYHATHHAVSAVNNIIAPRDHALAPDAPHDHARPTNS